jgi:hypothetical protein
MRWTTLATRPPGDAGTADTDPPQVGRRALRPAWQGLLAFVIYLGVFILAFGQALIVRLNVPAVGQTTVDPNFYIWAWRWWPYALIHADNPLHSQLIGAPGGYNLAWATASPPVALLMWPVTAAFGAVASFNVTLLLAPPAAAWAAFVLARRMTGRFWAALPAGVIFGFNVYMLQHSASGQPNLTVTLLLPLVAYLMVLWWQGTLGRAGYVTWMALAIALEFYTFIEAFAELALLGAIGLGLGFAVAGRELRGRVARLALLTAAAFAGAMVLAAPYLIYALDSRPDSLTRQEARFSLDWASLVLPRKDRLLDMTWWTPAAGHTLDNAAYLGVPLLLVLLGLTVFCWRSRLVRLLAIGFVIVIALASGPHLIVDGRQLFALPWGFIWSLPFFESAEPVRLIDFAYLLLSLAFALWIAELSIGRLARAARWALAAVALAAVLADLPTFASVVAVPAPTHWKQAIPALKITNDVPAFFADGTYKKYVQAGDTVVIVSHRGNAGMLFQAYTGFYFKIAGGFINASLSRVDALPDPVGLLSHPDKERDASFEAYVRSARISAIIVERAWSERWMYVFGKDLGMKSHTVGGVTIYSTATMKPVGLPPRTRRRGQGPRGPAGRSRCPRGR